MYSIRIEIVRLALIYLFFTSESENHQVRYIDHGQVSDNQWHI